MSNRSEPTRELRHSIIYALTGCYNNFLRIYLSTHPNPASTVIGGGGGTATIATNETEESKHESQQRKDSHSTCPPGHTYHRHPHRRKGRSAKQEPNCGHACCLALPIIAAKNQIPFQRHTHRMLRPTITYATHQATASTSIPISKTMQLFCFRPRAPNHSASVVV